MRIFSILAFLLTLPIAAYAAPWLVDRSASQITFQVGYLNGAHLNVVFPDYEALIDFDANHPENAIALITVQTASVDSRLAPVDSLIRSADYLDSDGFPTITFDLTGLIKTSKSTADLDGFITVRGITHPIQLKANVYKFDPFNTDPTNRVAAFEILGSLDRAAFGSNAGAPDIETVLPIRILLEIHPAG
jgi:polyisoprenoid-binding protein YceI